MNNEVCDRMVSGSRYEHGGLTKRTPPSPPRPCAPPPLHEPHLWLEAQINHAVRLVQHDVVALVQHRVVLLKAVNQAARRRDDNLTPAAQLGALGSVDGDCVGGGSEAEEAASA